MTVSEAGDGGDIFIVSPCYASAGQSICNGDTIKCDTDRPLDGARGYNGAVNLPFTV